MFWRNLLTRVSKWFDSAKKMVQKSLSSAYAKLRAFVATMIAKLRYFFVSAFLKLRGFVATMVAGVHNFFVTTIANIRNFFSLVRILYGLVPRLFSLINDLKNIFDSGVAFRRKLRLVLKIFDQLVDLGPIFGGMLHQH
ncbi:hypothetical protein Bca4012_055059 [Brassica carinata]